MQTIKKIIKNPRKIFVYMGSMGMLNWMPDKIYLKIVFRAIMGYKLDLKNPQTFSEKLQWIKINMRDPLWTKLVDKYEVKKYVGNIIGEEYIIPNLGIYEKFEEINFESLPRQFVLKCTHDSGGLIICKDKENLNFEEAEKKIKRSLGKNYFYWGREWPYKDVKPRIICEKYISDSNSLPDDYKVVCFNGKAKLIQIHRGRYENHTQDIYDVEWNKTDISQDNMISNIEFNKPKELNLMIELSEKLSRGIPQVRVDWFIVQNKLYFGEITFFDGSGMYPFDKFEHDKLLGDWIELGINNLMENSNETEYIK